MHEYRFTAPLWRWKPNAAWHFVTVPADISEVIRTLREPSGRGFGVVKVTVRLGKSRWQTSVFPQSADGTYVLPVKKQVRSAEGIRAGDEVAVHLALVEG